MLKDRIQKQNYSIFTNNYVINNKLYRKIAFGFCIELQTAEEKKRGLKMIDQPKLNTICKIYVRLMCLPF